MNYRHSFHAGNFADVFKHTLLIGLIDALERKPAPFCYLDTHAGAGSYDLSGADARKTGEAEEGFRRLFGLADPPPLLRAYIDCLRTLNDGKVLGTVRLYPGSPLIAARRLRADDRAVLCEVQLGEAAALRKLFAADARIGVHERDGYAALTALLPPKERRGLVLIDPPFEAQDGEFRMIEAALGGALQRWPGGVYAIWYPIKRREQTRSFHRWFLKCGAANVLVCELLRQPDDSPLRLNGCGMVIVNPPWQFDTLLPATLSVMAERLAVVGDGSWRVDWLVRA
jgi:23S rRNA (adenine2030-N6)-methyltransferase